MGKGREVSEFLLLKRGLYYGPNNQGYTGVRERAGRYLETDAQPACGVTAIHQDDAPLFAPACWQEVKVEYLLARIATLEDALGDILPGKLCGESWGLPDAEAVSITVTFGKLKAARAAMEGKQ